MNKITDIQEQKNSKDRLNLYLDGEFFCGLSKLSVLKSGLKIGSEIDKTTLEAVIFASECEVATTKALDKIARGRVTTGELKKHLAKKGFSNNVVGQTIRKMLEYNYINDSDYIDAYLEFCAKGKGKFKIIYELRQKGLDEQLIDCKLENFSENTDEILILAQKFMKGKEDNITNKGKLYRHLLSRGYNMENVYTALKLWKE